MCVFRFPLVKTVCVLPTLFGQVQSHLLPTPCRFRVSENSISHGPAWYCSKWIGRSPAELNSIQALPVLVRPECAGTLTAYLEIWPDTHCICSLIFFCSAIVPARFCINLFLVLRSYWELYFIHDIVCVLVQRIFAWSLIFHKSHFVRFIEVSLYIFLVSVLLYPFHLDFRMN